MKFVEDEENGTSFYFIILSNFKNRYHNQLLVANFIFDQLFSCYFDLAILFFIFINLFDKYLIVGRDNFMQIEN